MIRHSLYHKSLRTSVVVAAFLLVFQSGVFSSTTGTITRDTVDQLASVIGMSASVLPNEQNTINAQLEEKRIALEEREIAVSLRERDAGKGELSTLVLSFIVFVLLLLMIVNYMLDFARMRTLRDRKDVPQINYEKVA